ncbi:hypothetical protein [Bdellovibrio bacteriovorus]|uniref:Uncharacterized protein n=1 Tax=Bdellovibrio bacteriovorus str. Tiberius TaxID=1069642 RepID=K7YYU9_BDEBC|nr:hypothetical protein [Bdellovibrio bacteriovorus]AFY02898.1 hypothetical protein Bdt_3223 [Bdellovibrio bacteriovorus str. Tiberius]
MRNQQGFAAILILALLPILVSGLFLVAAMMGFLQLDLAMKHTCRSEGLQGQEKVRPHLEKLLSLNSKAVKLKAQLISAQAKAKAAEAAGNIPVATAAELEVLRIEGLRLALDAQQKQLIQQSNLQLQRSHSSTRTRLYRAHRENQTRLNFLTIKTQIENEPIPRLAVRPDFPDTAPTYSPEPDFEVRQALAQRWQYRIALRPPLSNFLKADFGFEKACAVTLTKGPLRWKTQITKGRYSLKSVW